ncbi:hypothetical protein CKM354_001291000 [Cercospora kikuchii]|uniref:Uncharacterized protein n=1 Tax=Cercospora kikuchii TaxID=84275 RepID=A0A9P3FMV3_9PEZI|nr:uncharacterized protein CKM354_001291000 [Cercospora kikuchii]GIZ49893.1 hypothetical protein CKM354_001291000 [Cercospora kikuchii]
MSQTMASSTAVPPLPKIDPSIMRPATKGSQQVAASSDMAMAPITRAADEEDLYQWSRQLSSSIPRETLKKARKAVGAGANSQEFRNFVQAHHISSKPAEIDQDSSASIDSQGSNHYSRFTLPPVDSEPAIVQGNPVKYKKAIGGLAPRTRLARKAPQWSDSEEENEYQADGEEDEGQKDDQDEGEEHEEDEEDEVVIITGDEDTKSSWKLPTPENSENSVSSAPSSGSEKAHDSPEQDLGEQAEASSAGEVSASTLQYWADHPKLDLDYKPPDPRWSKVDFNESLLELDSRTGLYHSRIPNEIDFVYERTVPTREVAFTLNDSGSIANARSFCQTSPHANEMLLSPYEPLLIIVKFSKPSTLFPLYPIGVAIASTSARTLKELLETALAMRLGGGKWKAKAMHYEWTEAMARKAREEGMIHLLDPVLYSRWAERDREEEAILSAELFGVMNADGKQLQQAVKSQEKTVELQQNGIAEDGAEQTAEKIAAGQSVEAEVQETDLEQDATALEIASEGKTMLLAGVLGLLLTAYMILYC